MLQYSPYVLLIFAASVFTGWLMYILWPRRNNSGVVPLMLMALGLFFWTFDDALYTSVTTYSAKSALIHLIYLGITIVPPMWLIFVLTYTGRERWVTRRNLRLLAIEPVLVQLMILFNGREGFFWTSRELVTIDGIIHLEVVGGLGFWLHAIYSYLLLVLSAYLLFRAMARAPHLYRGQIQLLFLAIFAPWIANFLYIFKLSPLPDYVDLTPLAFTVTVAAVGWNMYRYQFVDIIPVARDIIVENMDDGIFVLDNKNRIVDVNRAFLKLLDKTSESVIGQPVTSVLSNQGEFVQHFLNIDQIQTDIAVEIRGTNRNFNLRIAGLRNSRGELTGRIVSLNDITTLKEANNALEIARKKAEEATHLKSLFLATMSHELRTPLNAIIGYTELQLSGMVGDLSDDQYEYGERVLANSQHLLKLINDVLDLSKIEAGRMDLIEDAFSVEDWVNAITSQNAVLAKEKGLAFVTEIDPRLPAVLVGDAGRLQQIAVNLLGNAFKFTDKGTVHFRVRQESKNTWTLSVTDTGLGIAPHKQETIFTEFHQVDNSSTREYGGTGLGLAIVRKLALTMGGNVRVTSALGEGSTFTVTLPLIIEPIAHSVA